MPPVFRQGHDQSRHQDPARCHLVRSDTGREPRTSSVGSILDLAAERRVSRSLLRSRKAPRTLSPEPRDSASSRGRAQGPCYPALPRFASRLPSVELGEDAPHRLLQPTHDTSTRRFARLPGTRLSPHRPHRSFPARLDVDRSPRLDERFSCAAPDHLAAIRPQLALRLTAQVQLWLLATR